VSIRVVLVEPIYDFNVGMTARSMKNFGFKELYIVLKRRLGIDAIRFAAHASDIVENAVFVSDLEDAVKDVDYIVGTTGVTGTDYNIPRIAVPIWELRRALRLKGKIAILFGREDTGLRNVELEMCDVVATIPASSEYPVLNLSHAVAVTLYELSKGIHRGFKYRAATSMERRLILNFIEEALRLAGVRGYKLDNSLFVIRRILGRSFISGREAYTLMGCFRRIRNKLLQCESSTT